MLAMNVFQNSSKTDQYNFFFIFFSSSAIYMCSITYITIPLSYSASIFLSYFKAKLLSFHWLDNYLFPDYIHYEFSVLFFSGFYLNLNWLYCYFWRFLKLESTPEWFVQFSFDIVFKLLTENLYLFHHTSALKLFSQMV